MLSRISKRFRLDASQPPDSMADLEKLRTFSPVAVPEDYVELIAEGSELEFYVEGGDYIRIWGPTGCLEMNEAYCIQEHIPGSLALGDNERSAALIYVPHADPPGLYLSGFGCLDLQWSDYIAPSLTELLVHEVGIEVVK